MRILILQKWLNYIGGSETQVSHISTTLAKRGHSVYLWTASISGEIYPDIISCSDLKIIGKNTKSKSYFNLYLSLLSKIKELKIDIIYTRDQRRFPIYFLISKLLDIPIVLHINMSLESTPCNIKQLVKTTITESRQIQKLSWWQFSSYINFKLFPNIHKILVQTSNQEAFIKSIDNECTIVPNAHNISDYKINKIKKKVLLWVGNFRNGSAVKRPEYFVRLSKRFQNENLIFVMVGRNYADKFNSAEFIAKVKKIPNLFYLGELPSKTVNNLFSKSWCFINTSTMEGFPNTFIQSWFSELPVLSLEVDYNRKLENKECGFLCNNLETMEKNLRTLLQNKEFYQNISKSSKSFALENLEISKVIKKYEKVFNEVINNNVR